MSRAQGILIAPLTAVNDDVTADNLSPHKCCKHHISLVVGESGSGFNTRLVLALNEAENEQHFFMFQHFPVRHEESVPFSPNKNSEEEEVWLREFGLRAASGLKNSLTLRIRVIFSVEGTSN